MGSSFADANRFKRAMRTFAASSVGSSIFKRTAHHADRFVSRMTKGKRTFAGIVTGVPTVFLTTTGAKSGQPRTVPVLGVPHKGGLGVIASNFGQTTHPAWFHNLKANPEAEVTVDGERQLVRARLVPAEERDVIWATGLTIYPGWKNYEVRSGDREIQAFALEPR